MNLPTIGDRYRHYSGTTYTFLGFIKSVQLQDQNLIIVSNSLIALQDEAGHIIVQPLSYLSDILHDGKVQKNGAMPDMTTNYHRYQKLQMEESAV